MPLSTRISVAGPAATEQLRESLRELARGTAGVPAVIAIPVRQLDGAAAPELGSAADDVADLLTVSVAELLACAEMTGRAGETAQAVTRLGGAVCTLLFLGVGDGSPAALRTAGAALGRRVAAGKTALASVVADGPAGSVQAFVEGVLLGSYRFSARPDTAQPELAEVRLLLAPGLADTAERGSIIAGAVALARDLANMPSLVKTPEWLAAQAARVAADTGLTSRIWAEPELTAGGFGGLLGVGAGSSRPPRLIELSYRPAGASRHVVLVGKGITFDTGGLSLKPNDGMQLMKTDMAAGAAVIAAMSALQALGATVAVTGLVAAAENMPSGSALRVGDVIRHYGGQTVEVLNTDAEGRLVLADALAYADSVLDPDYVVDLATLTGAARVALASFAAPLYANDDELASALLESGLASGDRLWRMPLVDDYREVLDSPVADLSNVARSGGYRPGSIDAALFLREFAGGRRWAHLDIAGAARATADSGDTTKGATGFGTRLLLHWLTTGQPA